LVDPIFINNQLKISVYMIKKIKKRFFDIKDYIEEKLSDLQDNIIVDSVLFIFSPKRWYIFGERSFMLIVVALIGFVLWICIGSLIVAPFYSLTASKTLDKVTIHDSQPGITTVNSLKDRLVLLVDEGLITNFVGVRFWIDNRKEEQIGEIEMYRVQTNVLENNLARNRGSGGANKCLERARADIYADLALPMFTSYTTRMKGTISGLDCYVKQLNEDQNKDMISKRAVFIVNSDNLAEALNKMKQQLQTNLKNSENLSFFNQDNKFFRIRGNLIALSYFLKGIEHDFKEKMADKSSYDENFIPILQLLEEVIEIKPFIIWQGVGHLSKITSKSNEIAMKLQELRDKLKDG